MNEKIDNYSKTLLTKGTVSDIKKIYIYSQ